MRLVGCAALERGDQARIDRCELALRGAVQPELAAALYTHDHRQTSSPPTPLAVGPRFAALQLLRRLRATGQCALHGLELSLHLVARAQARQFAVKVITAARADLGQRRATH